MELIRVGDKLISIDRLNQAIEDILRYRSQGASQTEAAGRYNVDRSFVSRLETLGEVRRGRSLALVGFPVSNPEALQELCNQEGVDFCWVMTDDQRRNFAQNRSGIELVNEIMRVASVLRSFDVVFLLASNARVRLMEALLDTKTVIPVILGPTPLTEDIFVDPEELRLLIRSVRQAGELS
ncbi:MAG: transcriptional regulator [Sulfobacillus benefaciens]|uniref:Transcriptional regulator n=1 Tax=Sulfobacillus benefaciens TaxID=453960 RepID=A0A2T2XD29_9FIRM|nr:MAG: transcriptional regulator [Sulfobacillus benefaciens]